MVSLQGSAKVRTNDGSSERAERGEEQSVEARRGLTAVLVSLTCAWCKPTLCKLSSSLLLDLF